MGGNHDHRFQGCGHDFSEGHLRTWNTEYEGYSVLFYYYVCHGLFEGCTRNACGELSDPISREILPADPSTDGRWASLRPKTGHFPSSLKSSVRHRRFVRCQIRRPSLQSTISHLSNHSVLILALLHKLRHNIFAGCRSCAASQSSSALCGYRVCSCARPSPSPPHLCCVCAVTLPAQL